MARARAGAIVGVAALVLLALLLSRGPLTLQPAGAPPEGSTRPELSAPLLPSQPLPEVVATAALDSTSAVVGSSAAPEPSPPWRATTWLVLRVSSAGAEVEDMVHKDALPYAPQVAGPTRFRLIDPDGSELSGPCDWPRLCTCGADASHTRGCIRRNHTGSVRLRLPRLRGASQVVIERRAGAAWAEVLRLEVSA